MSGRRFAAVRSIKELGAELEKNMDDSSEFEVWQDDEMVASTSGPRDIALREALSYAGQYVNDGPVDVYEVTRKLVPRYLVPNATSERGE